MIMMMMQVNDRLNSLLLENREIDHVELDEFLVSNDNNFRSHSSSGACL